jgi:hypothetical protein
MCSLEGPPAQRRATSTVLQQRRAIVPKIEALIVHNRQPAGGRAGVGEAARGGGREDRFTVVLGL